MTLPTTARQEPSSDNDRQQPSILPQKCRLWQQFVEQRRDAQLWRICEYHRDRLSRRGAGGCHAERTRLNMVAKSRKVSVTKLIEEMATILLADFDAEKHRVGVAHGTRCNFGHSPTSRSARRILRRFRGPRCCAPRPSGIAVASLSREIPLLAF
jgi:hypothetical protein